MTNEHKLILLLSRNTFSNTDIENLNILLSSKIDWYDVYILSMKNKVLGLIWYNLCKLGYENLVYNRLAQVSQFMIIGTEGRNELLYKEMLNVLGILLRADIKCVPTKGMCLYQNLYPSTGLRTNVDIDLFYKKKDEKEILNIMKETGYSQGDYDSKEEKFIPVSREKQLLWKMNMNNMIPFKKYSHAKFLTYYTFDFCSSLDLKLESTVVEDMIDRAVIYDEYYRLDPSDMLLHLCCHLYKEAINAVDVLKGSDLNLIKFCDVREYVMKMSKRNITKTIEYAKYYRKEEALYYVFFYLKQLYNDGYENEILVELQQIDSEFINYYGMDNYSKPLRWKKDFFTRLFSTDNTDELPDVPAYFSLTSHEKFSWK